MLIREIPNVADVAVVGIPDERAGEVPRAYVVRRENSSLKDSDITDFVKSRAAVYKQLKGGVKFVDVIPRNPSGKIVRSELKKL